MEEQVIRKTGTFLVVIKIVEEEEHFPIMVIGLLLLKVVKILLIEEIIDILDYNMEDNVGQVIVIGEQQGKVNIHGGNVQDNVLELDGE